MPEVNLTSAVGHVAVVGAMNMDIAAHTPTAPLLADSNPGRITCAAGGVGRNIAENLARLGVPTQLLSVVGDDVFGAELLQSASKLGIGLVGCEVLAHTRSSSYLSLHGPDGDMAVAVNDMAIVEHITPAWLGKRSTLWRQARCVVLDCNLPPDSISYLVEMARQSSPPTIVFAEAVSAAKCEKLRPVLPHLHTLKVNRLEAQTLLGGRTIESAHDACVAAQALCALGVANVVLTLGAQGAACCTRQSDVGDTSGASALACAAEQSTSSPSSSLCGFFPAGRVPVVNTSGVGDALLAGLVYGHLATMPLGQAVRWAMACAELTLASHAANAANLSVQAVQAHLATSY